MATATDYKYPAPDEMLDKIAERQAAEDQHIRTNSRGDRPLAAQAITAASASICTTIVWATVKICEAIRETMRPDVKPANLASSPCPCRSGEDAANPPAIAADGAGKEGE